MIEKLTVFTRLAVMHGMLVVSVFAYADEQQQSVEPRIALKVLYAGNPDSDRAQDFQQLLSQHFELAEITDYGSFKSADAANYDVVIFDWTSTYPRDEDGTINWEKEDGFSSPPAPRLPNDFDRPAVLLGAAGGSMCSGLNIAINWK